jgi:hypothetical protein
MGDVRYEGSAGRLPAPVLLPPLFVGGLFSCGEKENKDDCGCPPTPPLLFGRVGRGEEPPGPGVPCSNEPPPPEIGSPALLNLTNEKALLFEGLCPSPFPPPPPPLLPPVPEGVVPVLASGNWSNDDAVLLPPEADVGVGPAPAGVTPGCCCCCSAAGGSNAAGGNEIAGASIGVENDDESVPIML